jgi:hypothetical protein
MISLLISILLLEAQEKKIVNFFHYDHFSWARLFVPVHTGPEANPAPCTIGTVLFPGVKRPEHSADYHPSLSPSSTEVPNGLELYIRLPSMSA